MLSAFHFLRPWWFVALVPVLLLFIWWQRKQRNSQSIWAEHCDADLLKYLLVEAGIKRNMWLPRLIFFVWVSTILALAGPTWSQYAEPVYQKNIARVIALDVSPYMNANDISPSRIERAKYKVLDLLHAIKEGQTGMVVFSGAPFVVSPLTSDSNTIASMVPVLDSSIVPLAGSDIGKALQKSAQLLKQAGFSRGQILLITASKPDATADKIAAQLAAAGYTTSVLAIGTKQGAPVAEASGGFANDVKGDILFAKLDSRALQKLANAGNGEFSEFSNDNHDITQLLAGNKLDGLSAKPSQELAGKSLWRDEGHWLIWLLIAVVGCLARKGWLEKLC